MPPEFSRYRISGVAGKVLAWMAAVVILVLGVAAWYHSASGSSRIQTDLFTRAEKRARYLAISLRQAIYGFDRETIRSILRAEFEEAEVQAMVITVPGKGHDRVLFSMQRTREGIVETASPPEGDGLAFGRHAIEFQRSNDASGTKEILGSVGVFLTPKPAIAALARELQGYALELAALLTGLLFVSSLILGGALVRPLEAIRRSMLAVREMMTSSRDKRLPRLPEENPVTPSRSAFQELRQMGDVYKMMLQAINERQEALSQSEEDLRITLDSIGEAVIAANHDGRIVRLNPAAGRLLEREPLDCLGRPLYEILSLADEESRTLAHELLPRVLKNGAPVRLAKDIVVRLPSGGARQVAISGAPIRNGDGDVLGAVLVFHDVTEQRRLEERLRHTQKMDAIGQLAGGVAHDFNNMLAGILGYAELLQEAVQEDERLHGYACNVVQTSQRAAALTRQLLTYSRKGAVLRKPIRLQQVIMDVLSILRRTIDRRVEIIIEFSGTDPLVLGDPGLIQNALLNLAVNARDAMPDGGKLEFRTSTVTIDEVALHPGFDVEPGMFVEVLVCDSGVGMSPEVQQRLFEPFFTTKDVGKGTGLGLAAVYGTMKEHFGAVAVKSEPGQGTTFRLLFPVAPKGVMVEQDGQKSLVHPTGSGTILIVDDEQLIRQMMQSSLEVMGFSCIEAADGVTALERFNEHRHSVRMVILDLVLPRRHGREVLAEIRKLDAGKPVLVISGFSHEEQARDLAGYEKIAFLQKPFTMSLFQQKVSELLKES